MTIHPVNARLHATAHAAATRRSRATLGLILLMLPAGACLAEPADLGRLFYTPAQRTALEGARARKVSRLTDTGKATEPATAPAPAPQRFDGIVIRSDGAATRWVNGQPEVGASSVPGLKPGQVRANGKTYEPYQIIRPQPSAPPEPRAKDAAP